MERGDAISVLEFHTVLKPVVRKIVQPMASRF